MITLARSAFDRGGVGAELSLPHSCIVMFRGRPAGRPLWPPGSLLALSSSASRYDVIVVGSGFGGAMAAHTPVLAGGRVLMLERGGWVERGPHNWEPGGAMEVTPFYSRETPDRVHKERRASLIRVCHCVSDQLGYYGEWALD